jgi:4'-phosphopantetheinyl transferase
VHLWFFSREVGARARERLRETLGPEELERSRRFRFERDRNRFIAGRGTLRAVLGLYLDRPPSRLRFRLGSHGKPHLEEDDVSFNLSHSGRWALLAVSAGRQVGVDVERIDRARSTESIAERFFSPAEVSALRGLRAFARTRAFFRCWTRKEAYIKARGEGLSIPLDSFSVSIEPASASRLLGSDQGDTEIARWTFRDVDPAPGVAGAVAAEGESWAPRFWRCPPALLGG